MRPRKYTRINVEEIDYKDLNLLRRFISDKGKTRSRRVTGLAQAPTPAGGGGEACARDRPASLRRGALMAQAILLRDVHRPRGARRRRRGLSRLPPQLPGAEKAGATGRPTPRSSRRSGAARRPSAPSARRPPGQMRLRGPFSRRRC